ncbi:MAG: hypothetical protein ABH836_02375 [Candidatus Omnitrophota bacterium]
MNDISPEERLFKIIEQANTEGEQQTDKTSETAKKTEFLREKIKKYTINIIRKIDSLKKGSFEELNVAVLNKVLIGILCVSAGFLLMDFIRLSPGAKKLYERISIPSAGQLKRNPVVLLEPLSVYLNVAAKRDIFNPVLPKTEQVKIGGPSTLSEMAKDLNLVGIYRGDVPEAMIENSQEKKTYFLKIGETIRGIRIEAILEDRVILEYNNETMELM